MADRFQSFDELKGIDFVGRSQSSFAIQNDPIADASRVVFWLSADVGSGSNPVSIENSRREFFSLSNAVTPAGDAYYFLLKGTLMSRFFLKVALISSLATPAMAQDVDPVRSAEFVSALEAHGCVLSQAGVQDFVLSNGFGDARETQAIVGALIAAGDARTEGADLILQTSGCTAQAQAPTQAPVPPAPTPAPAPTPTPAAAICPTNALSLSSTTSCTCQTGSSIGSVWGTGVYTADSSICAAAVHAGVIGSAGGQVIVTLSGGLSGYPGSQQNGVTSNQWGAYDRSFSLASAQAAAPVPAPQPAPQPVSACPSFAQPGQIYNMTGQQLYSPQTLSVQAGGNLDISNCGVGGIGFANSVPHFSFNLSGMESYGRLEIEIASQCDTTVLVNTPTAQWVFDDDSRGNFQPLLNLPSSTALNGRLDIWVGTFDGSACPATVELETWQN